MNLKFCHRSQKTVLTCLHPSFCLAAVTSLFLCTFTTIRSDLFHSFYSTNEGALHVYLYTFNMSLDCADLVHLLNISLCRFMFWSRACCPPISTRWQLHIHKDVHDCTLEKSEDFSFLQGYCPFVKRNVRSPA